MSSENLEVMVRVSHGGSFKNQTQTNVVVAEIVKQNLDKIP